MGHWGVLRWRQRKNKGLDYANEFGHWGCAYCAREVFYRSPPWPHLTSIPPTCWIFFASWKKKIPDDGVALNLNRTRIDTRCAEIKPGRHLRVVMSVSLVFTGFRFFFFFLKIFCFFRVKRIAWLVWLTPLFPIFHGRSRHTRLVDIGALLIGEDAVRVYTEKDKSVDAFPTLLSFSLSVCVDIIPAQIGELLLYTPTIFVCVKMLTVALFRTHFLSSNKIKKRDEIEEKEKSFFKRISGFKRKSEAPGKKRKEKKKLVKKSSPEVLFLGGIARGCWLYFKGNKREKEKEKEKGFV